MLSYTRTALQHRTQASIYAPDALPLRKNPGPGWSLDTSIFVNPWGGGAKVRRVAPSTRTGVNLKPRKYFRGYAFRPHVTG